MDDSKVIEMIEAREAMKSASDDLDKKRKAVDAEIEAALGPGTHHIDKWSVTITDTTEERFDSTKFKKEHPDMVTEYLKSGDKHIFRIVEMKA